MDIAELGFRVDTSGFGRAERAMDRLEGRSRRAGLEGNRAGGLIDRSMRNAAGGVAVTSARFGFLRGAIAGLGIGNAVRTSRQFEAAMNDVEEKLNATSGTMDRVRTRAQEMGATTAFSASQAGDAIATLAQRGLDADDALQALPDVLNLASSSQISMAAAAQIVTDAMGQYNLGVSESTRLVDLFAGASDSSGANVQEFADALVKVGPRAASFNVSIEDTVAALGVLANRGVRASVAGTALSGMFNRLTNPVGEAKKEFAALGLELDAFQRVDANGQRTFIGMREAIDVLNKSGADSVSLMKILGEEAGKGLTPLIEAGAEAFDEMEKRIDSSSSALAQAETQMKGLPGATRNVASAWEAVNLAFVGSEGANFLAVSLNSLAEAMRFTATNAIPRLQPVIAGLTRRFAAARLMFIDFREALSSSDAFPFVALRAFGDQVRNVGELLRPVAPFVDDMVVAMAGIAAASAIFGTLSAAVGLLASPLVLVSAFAVAVFQIYENWDGIVDWWSGIWSDIRTTADSFLQYWRDTTFEQKVTDVATLAIDAARDVATDFFTWWDQSTLKQIAPSIIVDGIDAAREAGTGFLQWWDNTTFEEKKADIKHAAIGLAQQSAQGFSTFWNDTTFAQKVLFVPRVQLEAAYNLAREFVEFWNGGTLQPYLPKVVVDSIDSAIVSIRQLREWWETTDLQGKSADITFELVTRAYEALKQFGGIWDTIVEALKNPLSIDFEFPSFESIQSKGSGLLDKMRQFGGDIVSGIGDGMTRARDHIDAAEQINDDVEFALNGLPANMESVGNDVAQGLANGLSAGQADALDAADNVSAGVLSRFRSGFRTQSPSKETQQIGLDVASGLTIGINDGASDAVEAARVLSEGVLANFGAISNAANDAQFGFTNNVISPDQFSTNQVDPAAIARQNLEAMKAIRDEDVASAADHSARISTIGATQVESERQKFSDLTASQQLYEAASVASGFIDAFKQQVGSYISLNENMTEAERAQAQASNALNRRRFEDNKKASIAQAIISTITGSTRAFETVPFPLNFAAAAAVTAAGLRNVANIRSQSFGGGSVSSGGGSGSVPTTDLNTNTNANRANQTQQSTSVIFVNGLLPNPNADDYVGDVLKRLSENELLTDADGRKLNTDNIQPVRMAVG